MEGWALAAKVGFAAMAMGGIFIGLFIYAVIKQCRDTIENEY